MPPEQITGQIDTPIEEKPPQEVNQNLEDSKTTVNQPNIYSTGDITPPEPIKRPIILSSAQARRATKRAQTRLGELQQELNQVQPVSQETPRGTENSLSPQEAQNLFSGDLSQLEFDDKSGRFFPKVELRPEQTQAINQARVKNQELNQATQILNNIKLRSSPSTKALADLLIKRYQQRLNYG